VSVDNFLLSASATDLNYPEIRPSLDLNFARTKTLDPRITFTRSSGGSYVGADGLIKYAGVNEARFDHNPVTGESLGLLIEEPRTNLLISSNNFSASGGNFSTLYGGSITANVITSPDGTTNASKFISDTNPLIAHYPQKSASSTAGNNYTLSVFLKAAEVTTIVLVCGGVGYYTAATFNLITGVATPNSQDVGVSNATTYSITPYPNGWYRCSVTSSTSNDSGWAVQIRISNGTKTNGVSGDGISGYYVYGMQVEVGSFPTSYIPTQASTVTRAADNAQITGTNFSSWYNQTEGTLYADLNNITTRSSITYDAFVSLAGTDVNRNVIRIYTQTSSGGGAQNKFFGAVAYSPDGSYVFDSFDGNVGGPDRIGKAILSYKKDNFAFTVNGLTPTRDVSGDIPTCNQLLIFGASRFQPAPSGTIRRLTYWPKRLPNSQLQALTR
jgi:hypothetical protein